MQFHIIFETRQ